MSDIYHHSIDTLYHIGANLDGGTTPLQTTSQHLLRKDSHALRDIFVFTDEHISNSHDCSNIAHLHDNLANAVTPIVSGMYPGLANYGSVSQPMTSVFLVHDVFDQPFINRTASMSA